MYAIRPWHPPPIETPEITGYTLLSTMVKPSSPAILETTWCSSTSLVYITKKWPLKIYTRAMHSRPINSDSAMMTITACIAALGRAELRSLETQTQMLTESTTICTSQRLLMIMLWYHISRQSMTIDSRESLTKAHISLNAAMDHPLHPSLHHPVMYAVCHSAMAHRERSYAPPVVGRPQPRTEMRR